MSLHDMYNPLRPRAPTVEPALDCATHAHAEAHPAEHMVSPGASSVCRGKIYLQLPQRMLRRLGRMDKDTVVLRAMLHAFITAPPASFNTFGGNLRFQFDQRGTGSDSRWYTCCCAVDKATGRITGLRIDEHNSGSPLRIQVRFSLVLDLDARAPAGCCGPGVVQRRLQHSLGMGTPSDHSSHP